jgi:predicted RNA-binding protein YlqC (UPF0109 family)
MKEFLEYVVKHLIENPDKMSIEIEEKDDKVVFRLRVDDSDLGKVIGRRGRTIQALRTLLSALSAKERKRAIIEVIE